MLRDDLGFLVGDCRHGVEGGDVRVEEIIADLVDQILNDRDSRVHVCLIFRRAISSVNVHEMPGTFEPFDSVGVARLAFAVAQFVGAMFDRGVDREKRCSIGFLERHETVEADCRGVDGLLTLGDDRCPAALLRQSKGEEERKNCNSELFHGYLFPFISAFAHREAIRPVKRQPITVPMRMP